MPSGFEPSSVEHAFGSVRGLAEMLRALVRGPRVPPRPPSEVWLATQPHDRPRPGG
jgi:hypothetical protein